MDFLNPAQRLQFLQYLVDIQRDIAKFDGAIAQVVQARRRRRIGNRRRVVWVCAWLHGGISTTVWVPLTGST